MPPYPDQSPATLVRLGIHACRRRRDRENRHWDGDGFIVKRVEPLRPNGGRAADLAGLWLQLISANPDYPPYERPAADVHIVGRVLWKVTRV